MTSNFDTSDRNAQKGGDFVPRLAMINDYCAIIGLNQKDLENQGILA